MPDNTRYFGIDLGTTNSAIAYIDESGIATPCRNQDGYDTTPSVAYFESPSNVIVGIQAKNAASTDPQRTLSLIKRKMGTIAPYEFNGIGYTPESISALILKQLAQDAAEHTGGEVHSVVITVPAYFGLQQRDATKKAGAIAGLHVLGIVPEPVAAALYYEATMGAVGKTILVYDLGGGTFDTSVIRVESNEITVLCTDGNDRLGGADWDRSLFQFLHQEVRQQVPPDTDVDSDESFLQMLASQAEEAKIGLTKREKLPVRLMAGGTSVTIDVTRERLEELTQDKLDTTIEIVRRTLDTLEKKTGSATIDEVLLVGGMTKMPAVAQRLRAEFGWDPRLRDPDLAVAKGAALFALGQVVFHEIRHELDQSGTESGKETEDAEARIDRVIGRVSEQTGMSPEAVRSVAVKETHPVLAKAHGVKLVDTRSPGPRREYVHHIVLGNDPLPAEEQLKTTTVEDGQTTVKLELYEQDGLVASPEVKANKRIPIPDDVFIDLPSAPAGSLSIEITMTVTEEGLLELSAWESTTRQKLTNTVEVGLLSKEQVQEAKELVAGITVSG
ncbi:Hsp70 family protein [Streptomyces lunaelactis]|uniref:Hsp70 family protein n=1 Tax=Streptomyces lunaelactis TaxID=1535768 RepID=UPI0015854CF1|nr:Hsp70 family protein [Streptomyces lunaelactis]NUJ99652.1 Hsp70 family protein [Streptomyces lunaelactis]NUK14247.1 Hsp70 family protein [Streptomyces lunaelactis]